jgi:hypothetical protein
MRRILLWTLLGLAVLVIALVSIVSVRVSNAEELPPPDPALPIAFSDGSTLPLSEVLDRARRGLPLPVEPPTVLQSVAIELGGTIVANPAQPVTGPLTERRGDVDPDPIFALAEQNRADGKLDQALALYLSIPPDSQNYARARRIAAWNILARDLHKPEWAVKYANQALAAAPLDDSAWEDWWRVYARTLGLPVE